jgi:hypothetical protein
MKINTVLESAIERRNHYQGRMAENMANIIYFTKRKAAITVDRNKLKADTEERAALNREIAQADKAVQNGKDNIEQDQMFMDSFDELIAELKKK